MRITLGDWLAAFSANLQGCWAYAARGHWHYVTYGLSELYVPAPDSDREVSRWETPTGSCWSRATARDALASHGHPRVPDAPSTSLTMYAVTIDSQLGRISTPNGSVQFFQVVGVTAAEKELMLASSTADVLTGLARNNWLLITDPHRARGDLTAVPADPGILGIHRRRSTERPIWRSREPRSEQQELPLMADDRTSTVLRPAVVGGRARQGSRGAVAQDRISVSRATASMARAPRQHGPDLRSWAACK